MSYAISEEMYERLKLLVKEFSVDEASEYFPGDSGNYDDCYEAGLEHGKGRLAADLLEDIEKLGEKI